MIILRIFTTLLLVFLIPLLPWPLWLLCVLCSIFLWKNYYEIVVIGFIYDLVIGGPAAHFWFPATIGFAVVCVIVEVIKKNLTLYNRS